jgi:hypothetical protein
MPRVLRELIRLCQYFLHFGLQSALKPKAVYAEVGLQGPNKVVEGGGHIAFEGDVANPSAAI